jgi:hypothetical protein
MAKCKYCKRLIPDQNIRCDVCDSAWQDGRSEGWKVHENKVGETIRTLIRLGGYDIDTKRDEVKHGRVSVLWSGVKSSC